MAMVIGLSGCGERPQPVNRPPQQVLAPEPPKIVSFPDAPATAPTATVWVDPVLEDCGSPQIATIHWDASKSSASTVDVKIFRDDGGENLFATSDPVGSEVTQAWMRPGLLVLVRDHETGAELGRKIVEAKPCSR